MAEPGASGTGGRLGVLGSAFNPPHLGHLLLAQEAAYRLGLDRVMLVPTGEAPHKRIESDPGSAVRLRLARLAAEGERGVEASPVEVDRDGPSYTCETLERIIADDSTAEITFLMGADAALGLADWHRPRRVLELARVAVARRPGIEMERVAEVFDSLGAPDRWQPLEMPEVEVSSTMIRRRAAEGAPIRHLVPDAVADAIEAERIYANG